MTKAGIKNNKEKKETLVPLSTIIVTMFRERIHQNKMTIPFSITYGTGAYCGMTALSKINIPLYFYVLCRFLALRRTLIFFVFLIQLIMGKSKKISASFLISVFLITSGAIIAGM